MQQWNLQHGDPYTLTIGADQRLTQTNYSNDHIWELLLGTGDPAAVLLQTTYGLRARNMRIFPRFVESDKAISNPNDFNTPPTLEKFHPNYIQISFSPFAGLEVTNQYWVPDCQTIAGRIRISNSGVTPRNLRAELVAMLNPSGDDPQAMTPIKKEVTTILQGRSQNLTPTLFITGGAVGYTSPFPALVHDIELLPGSSRRFTWVLSSLGNPDEAFQSARQTATRNWDAEVAQIEMINENQVQIETGNPDWDAAFAFGQSQAYLSLHSPTPHLPHPSFVSTRLPDQGFSHRGDGSDYTHLWNGQTALEAWYLTGLLLPGDADTAKGLLNNFLSIQQENGQIDWKPGLAGQRGQMQATPVLVSLAWRIYQTTQDKDYLKEVFPQLLRFIQHWFMDQYDRDGDGIPEWNNTLQSGFDDNPTFARWHAWSQAADITLAECPDLCAYLYRECQLLIQIANIIERPEPISALEALAGNLRTALDAAWDARSATYRYWDRETHQSPKGEMLKSRKGSGELFLDMVFELPARLLVRMEAEIDAPPQAQATLHGTLPEGQHRVTRLKRPKLLWTQGIGTATLDELYAEIEHIQIEELPSNGKVSIQIIDLRKEDHSLLVPLWAEIPSQDIVGKIVKRKLLKPTQYYKPYGIPACPKPPKHSDANICRAVWLPWNVMIGEALLTYGYRTEVVDLVTRLMDGIIQNLKRENAFRKHYHAEEPIGIGERNALAGLPPISLFLDTLGIQIISPWEVFIHVSNPFPWPVKLQYRGMIIHHQADETTLIFPDGQSITLSPDQLPCHVKIETTKGTKAP